MTAKPAQIDQVLLWLVNSIPCVWQPSIYPTWLVLVLISFFDFFYYKDKVGLEHFQIDKFREKTAGCHFKFVKRKKKFSFTANGLMKVLNLSVLFASWSMLRKQVWFTSCALATSMLDLLMQHRARSRTWTGVRAAFISDEQNDKYMCYT